MVNIKTEKEIQTMKEGGKILGEILKKLEEAVKPGMTINNLEELTHELVLSYGVKSSFLGFEEYPNMLCTSLNDEVVHGLPSDRVLKEGDLLKIDMGVLHKGFHIDSAPRDLVGHGIGREPHEPPQVLNYGKAGTGEKLIAGMVIAIEPMVVTGKWGIKNGKDGYAFVTKDGGLAAHFEHTIAITEKGPEILTK